MLDENDYISNVIWAETCPANNIKINWGYRERFFVHSGTNYAGGCGLQTTRAALFFDEIDRIPSNIGTIRSAKLKLFGVMPNASNPQNWMGFDVRYPNDLWVQRITSPWSVNTTNWVNQPTTTEVNAASIPGINTWIEYNPVIDVTALVNDMRARGQSNYGFMLKCKTETPYRSMTFWSFGHHNAALRPQLEIIY